MHRTPLLGGSRAVRLIQPDSGALERGDLGRLSDTFIWSDDLDNILNMMMSSRRRGNIHHERHQLLNRSLHVVPPRVPMHHLLTSADAHPDQEQQENNLSMLHHLYFFLTLPTD